MVMGGDSCSKGSNPGTVYWMDIFSYFCRKTCNVFEKNKINENEAGDGPVFFKKNCLLGKTCLHKIIFLHCQTCQTGLAQLRIPECWKSFFNLRRPSLPSLPLRSFVSSLQHKS